MSKRTNRNLLRGPAPGVKPPPPRDKAARDDAAKARKICQKLVNDPLYQATLKSKLQNCTLHPSVQTMLWSRAYGTPPDNPEEKQAVPVRIEHVYSDGTP